MRFELGILENGASFLRSTLPVTVMYTEPGAEGVEISGVWSSTQYDRHNDIGVGAERNTQEAVFHVERSVLSTVNQQAIIRRGEVEYQIHNVEPIMEATYRLHLRRTEGFGASPIRPLGRR